jgi:hypothetical protein
MEPLAYRRNREYSGGGGGEQGIGKLVDKVWLCGEPI